MIKAAQAGATDDVLAGMAEYSLEERDASIDAVVSDMTAQLDRPDDDRGPTTVN